MTDPNGFKAAVDAAAVCEVVWTGPDGRPDARAATPLWLDGAVALAFPYAEAARARAIGASARVAVVLSDRRMSGSAWRPLALTGEPRVIEDTEGELMRDRLLRQELRKHPPSRTLADSIMLRREHWWYVPRVVVVVDVDEVTEPAKRDGGAADAVIATAGASVATAKLAAEPGREVELAWPHGDGPGAAGAPAVMLRHDFSTPDLERWTQWKARGTLAGSRFVIAETEGDIALPRPPGLLARLRRQRDLARGCRAELDRRLPPRRRRPAVTHLSRSQGRLSRIQQNRPPGPAQAQCRRIEATDAPTPNISD